MQETRVLDIDFMAPSFRSLVLLCNLLILFVYVSLPVALLLFASS